ncbi:MAG: serine/threonine-protein kinase RsbW [Frankiales bacterium]|nr:serine/threonine-protein kinase RsbW [Frankiales bacterium]
MELRLTLFLPRDELSIPVVRRTLDGALKALGVPRDEAHDIEVAVSEACTNVLDHVEQGEEYEITCSVSEDLAQIEVVDTGSGFDSEGLGRVEAEHTAEEGRGIQLIRALTDHVQFETRPGDGSIVRFAKRLNLPQNAPAKVLSGTKSR